MVNISVWSRMAAACLLCMLLCNIQSQAQELQVGTAVADITPPLPVALLGQFHLRLADTIETPLSAGVIALSSHPQGGAEESAIFVTCDLTVITPKLISNVREEVAKHAPDIDTKTIILTATHTHTAPTFGNENLIYPIPKNATQIDTYLNLLTQRISAAVEKAWKARRPASVTWGLTHAVVGHNRRAVYMDGTAAMYGGTNTPRFKNIEGYESHDVNSLFFWDKKGKLIAVGVDVPCPSQEVEGRNAVNADYWYEARLAIKKRLGKDICIVNWCGDAGDMSPHLMYGNAAQDRMNKLANLTRMQEIGRRIADAVSHAYDLVRNDRHSNVVFEHRMDTLMLPMRVVTDAEYADAKEKRDKIAEAIGNDSAIRAKRQGEMLWYQMAMDRYEKQKTDPNPKLENEIHAVRIGDAVICTNQFELFTDYGVRIQARSKALQTFVVQLAGNFNYLPTDKAVKGGSYSAIVESNMVGPAGGDILADRSVALINAMWPAKK